MLRQQARAPNPRFQDRSEDLTKGPTSSACALAHATPVALGTAALAWPQEPPVVG